MDVEKLILPQGIGTGSGDGMGGGLLGAVLLSSILGNRGVYGATPYAPAAAIAPPYAAPYAPVLTGLDITNAINTASLMKEGAETRMKVMEAEGDIQRDLKIMDNASTVRFAALDKHIADTHMNLHNNIAAVDKEVVIQGKDAQIRELETEARIRKDLTDFERNTDNNFCDIKGKVEKVNTHIEQVNTHLTHLIETRHSSQMLEIERTKNSLSLQAERNENKLSLQAERNENKIAQMISDKFCALETMELKEQLRIERVARENDRFAVFGDKLNGILNTVQRQQAAQDIINFGSGNLNGQSQNTNQVNRQ